VIGNPSRRPAFTLLEMLVVMTAIVVLLALTAQVLWAMVRIERAAAADFQRTLAQAALADQFRADVAAAADAPARLNDATADRRCLILKNGTDWVVYKWDGKQLNRTASGMARRGALSAGVDEADVEFTRAADGRLITLRLTETHGQGSARHTRPVEITAALGGDLR
jgi:prepilin-type N-terminal cleavage/methylation domain-containing protein